MSPESMESNSSSEETSEPQNSESAESQSVAEPKPKRPTRPAGALGARLFALAFALGGLFLAVVLMGAERPLPGGAVGAFLGCLLSTAGFLALATPAPQKAECVDAVAGRKLLVPVLALLGCGTVFLLSVTLAVAGVLPLHRFSAAVLVTATFLSVVVAAYRVCEVIGFFREPGEARRRPLRERHGFWLLVLGTLLYLPMLGNFALLDPWETHYGEVAREMLARDDWISLWWAQDGWFFTKPILNFWVQGLSFKIFGVGFLPDQMLAGAVKGYQPGPEWACRLPIFWMTLAAAYALYKACAALVGRRPAFLGGMVLLTTPYWVLLGRQTMADMPYVAPLVVGLALLLLAFKTEPEAIVSEYAICLGRWTLRFNAYHLLFGTILICLLPQVAYLFSRNLTLHLGDPFGFRAHLDEFARGSGGGNCGLPGNKTCRSQDPVYEWGQPVLAALLWLSMGLGLLFWNRKERRTQRLLYLAAWFATALSVMAKGAPGLALPLATALGFPIATGRFRELLRMKLPSLLLLTACIAAPWYFQMYMRHGFPFIDRLVMHDMVNRAFAHVHDTNTGDDVSFRYYLWQLGYGLFPWTGIAAGGLVWWARSRAIRDEKRETFTLFMLLWLLAAFGMFSLTLTKFHHYILPLVPPAAMLAGVLLARFLPPELLENRRRGLIYLTLMLLTAVLWMVAVSCFFPSWDHWFRAANTSTSPKPWLGGVLAGLGCLSGGAALFFGPRVAVKSTPKATGWALAAVAVGAAVVTALAGRDLWNSPDDLRAEIRLLHLITYNYNRPWPDTLNLTGPLAGFTLVAVVGLVAMAFSSLRRHGTVLLCAVAILFGGWCCNDYLVRIAPHWAQRDNMIAYYKHRDDPKQPLVAYQMNWKGENFYTGNRMATFVSSGSTFKRWLKKQRLRGVDTMFFTTEHSRTKSLKKELGDVESFEELTKESDNNKFFVAKVVFPPLLPDEAKVEDDGPSEEAD